MARGFGGRREDGRLITGAGRYTADWDRPGQAHAAFLRADRAHAAINRIDVAPARARARRAGGSDGGGHGGGGFHPRPGAGSL